MMRVGLFILTNLAVMFVFGIILSILGVDSHSTIGLLIFAAIFGFGGSFISLLLSKRMALRSVGGQIITQPSNNQEQWLFDVVRRLSADLNIKMPDIAIYDAQDVNAFATGATKNRSLVAVSSGLLNAMTQDEAEAVIGHEMSHIANGDMVTMTLLQGVLNTFVIFISRILASVVAQALDDRNRGLSQLAYFLIVMVFETVFGILASLIAMWFSRYREFHADAGSAKLVGSTKMIAALEKLKTSYEPNEDASILAFCINGAKKAKFSELFMSHPPLEKRIEALRNRTYQN
ncbi:heat shock protein HtpX [Gilliamella bombicola]|uniref:Protease HtpX n=1 Tax=Gilliamella bombicola TaxID=1798182 RepID=A0A1C3ZZJ8_9GAMM|nr:MULTISPECIES: protease HtpX [Gilliamella]NUF27107.1 protease HtpX [Gilliamella sp. ESL0254]SCB87798.1 heat shock protein HtpX [Gilliamella bombicola]